MVEDTSKPDAVIALYHDQWQVLGDSVEKHEEPYPQAVPQKEKGRHPDENPMGGFRSARFKKKCVQVVITCFL